MINVYIPKGIRKALDTHQEIIQAVTERPLKITEIRKLVYKNENYLYRICRDLVKKKILVKLAYNRHVYWYGLPGSELPSRDPEDFRDPISHKKIIRKQKYKGEKAGPTYFRQMANWY